MSALETENEAVDFFMGIMMDFYDGVSVDHRFLCTHLRYASDEVKDYMNEVYPVDFVFFFTKHKYIFNIDAKGNVSLQSTDYDAKQKAGEFVRNSSSTTYYPNSSNISSPSTKEIKEKTIKYFKNILLERYSMPVQYIYLRGHLGQASYDIIDYVRDAYPMNNFLFLFINNNDIFHVDNQGNVSLQPSSNKEKNTENTSKIRGSYQPWHSSSSQGSSTRSSSGTPVDSFTRPVGGTCNYENYQYATQSQANTKSGDHILSQSTNETEKKAIEYFRNIISERYSEPVHYSYLQGHLGQATEAVINYIRNVYPRNDFLLFFKNNNDIFQVDAGDNVLLLQCIDETEQRAVEYFKNILLERYSQPVLYTCLRGHLGQASDDIIDFLRETYPKEDFLLFFRNHDIFHVDHGGNVSLQPTNGMGKTEFVKSPVSNYYQADATNNAVFPPNDITETKAIEYFKSIISERYSEPIHYTCLQGHLGQATDDIIDYIRDTYPKDDFLLFFKDNDDIFEVDDSGNVSLEDIDETEKLAVDYFENILLERYSKPVLYAHLRGHLGQAADDIIDFISETYPKNEFLSFFTNNSNIFQVDAGGYVSLQATSGTKDNFESSECSQTSTRNSALLSSIKAIEVNAVEYFKNILLEKYSEPVLYKYLFGHLGQASDDIVDYIREVYPKNDFLLFFSNNNNIFQVNTGGYISLQQCIEQETVEYFEDILRNRYNSPVFYECLRGHLGQASDAIIDYMKMTYPNKNFLSFFLRNGNTFKVYPNGFITVN